MDIETPRKPTCGLLLWSLLYVEFMFNTKHLVMNHRTAVGDVVSVEYQRDDILVNSEAFFCGCSVSWYIIYLSLLI